MNTTAMQCVKYTRICVEIDLNKSILRSVWYNVEYEALHLLCASCCCYGHLAQNYEALLRQPPVQQVQDTMASVEVTTWASTRREKAFVTPAVDLAMKDATVTDKPIIEIKCHDDDAHGEWLAIVKKQNLNSRKVTNVQSTVKQTSQAARGDKNGNNSKRTEVEDKVIIEAII